MEVSKGGRGNFTSVTPDTPHAQTRMFHLVTPFALYCNNKSRHASPSSSTSSLSQLWRNTTVEVSRMSSALSSSPPTLPIPRQPSPLSFSSVSINEPPSPPGTSSSHVLPASPTSSTPPSSRILSHPVESVPFLSHIAPLNDAVSPTSTARQGSSRLPVEPAQDSLLLRSTFNALEHSTHTLKRLSKGVLNSTRAYIAMLEQVEKAEDEVFLRLGELARWLESGYSLSGDSIWEDQTGVRKLRRDARKREREELEVMVEHGVRAVKGELKRNGLAGHGAQTRFDVSDRIASGMLLLADEENHAKSFYSQTSEYLSPNASMPPPPPAAGPSGSQLSNGSKSGSNPSSGDLAQAARLAQFDLARYSHHSTLLYAVPPTSIPCLDLLVGLYSWAGRILGEDPELRRQSFTRRGTESTIRGPSQGPNQEIQLGPRANDSASPSTKVLKVTLSSSLSQLATIRTDLLNAWAKRNRQTTSLEDIAAERQAEIDVLSPDLHPSARWGEAVSTPISSSGIEHKKVKKMHKLHKSVGGKLRDLLSSSASSTSLVTAEKSDRLSRASIDIPSSREAAARSTPLQTARLSNNALMSSPIESDTILKTPNPGPPPPIPVRRPSTTSSRPSLQPRHSMHATRMQEYVSPFIAAQASDEPFLISESSPDLRLRIESLDNPGPLVSRLGGVGGLGAGGDEDEKREQVGRKKEGVLWGTGVWEGLTSRIPSKGKWESKSDAFQDRSLSLKLMTRLLGGSGQIQDIRGMSRLFVRREDLHLHLVPGQQPSQARIGIRSD